MYKFCIFLIKDELFVEFYQLFLIEGREIEV
jgi:hypothetical protein